MSKRHPTFRYHGSVHSAGTTLVSDHRTFLLGHNYRVNGQGMHHLEIPGYGNVFVAAYGADGKRTFQLMPSVPGCFVSQDHGNSWQMDLRRGGAVSVVDIGPEHENRGLVEQHLSAAGISF